MGAEAEERTRAVGEVVAEARQLLEEQRGALRRADFSALLSAASRFHDLAVRVSTLDAGPMPADAMKDLRALREEVTRQSLLLEKTIAITRPPTRVYHRSTPASGGSSLLVDRFA